MKQIFFIAFIGLTSLLNAQTVDIGGIQLNGTIGYSTTLNELMSSNIHIDSIRPIPERMDMSMADSLVYIGGTYYEYFANSNKCLLTLVKFDGRISEVKIGGLTLTKESTIRSIQVNFPQNCKTTNEIKIYQDPNSYSVCGIPISVNGTLTDSKLLFFFLDGKLARIDIWEPS